MFGTFRFVPMQMGSLCQLSFISELEVLFPFTFLWKQKALASWRTFTRSWTVATISASRSFPVFDLTEWCEDAVVICCIFIWCVIVSSLKCFSMRSQLFQARHSTISHHITQQNVLTWNLEIYLWILMIMYSSLIVLLSRFDVVPKAFLILGSC